MPQSVQESSGFLVAADGTKPFNSIRMHIDGQWLVAKRDGYECRYPLTMVSRVEY